MKNESLSHKLNKAKENNFLLSSTIDNILELSDCPNIPDWVLKSLEELLEEEHLTHACLDLDKEHSLVSKVVTSPDIASYVRITKSLLPILCNRELVAFFSSSIVADNKDKPNRMNLRVVVFFDKPYPREIVKRWIKTIGKVEIDEIGRASCRERV